MPHSMQTDRPAAALDEAADWLMRLNAGDVTEHDRAEWALWRSSSAEREQAWQRAESLLGKLGGLPPAIAMSALDRPDSPSRRAAIGKLAALCAMAPLAWATWQVSQRQGWSADYSSAVGERRELRLADGSQLTLNTDSAIDVLFDGTQRLIRLRRGEILVQTAPDAVVPSRPLRVSTAEGVMEALGTRFTVRENAGQTYLAVLEGAVRVAPGAADSQALQVVHAGEKTTFNSAGTGGISPVDRSTEAWTHGMLMADNMRLGDFVEELARYRHGFVRCAPDIADLRISGAFPISDAERALNMLQLTYPITAAVRMNGYWIALSAR